VFVVLAAAGAGSLAFLLFAFLSGNDPSGFGATGRGLWLVAHGQLRGVAIAAAFGVIVLAGAMAALVKTRPRGALTALVIASPVGLALAWIARAWVASLEDPRYRAKSPYVHGATMIAIAATIYFVLLGAVSTAAMIRARRISAARS